MVFFRRNLVGHDITKNGDSAFEEDAHTGGICTPPNSREIILRHVGPQMMLKMQRVAERMDRAVCKAVMAESALDDRQVRNASAIVMF